jgi:predicted nucleotidyltransferase
LARLAQAFFQRYPQLKAVAFYGSRAAGLAEADSDYDALLVLPDGLAWRERWEAAREIGDRFGVNLEVTATSPRSVEFHYRLFPDFRFRLKDAVIFGDVQLLNGHPPPTSKEGCENALIEAESWLIGIDRFPTLSDKAETYYRVLRSLLIVEEIIENDYNLKRLMDTLHQLLGVPLVRRLRRPGARIRRHEVERLAEVTQQTFERVKAKVEAMPSNESDAYIQQRDLERSRAAEVVTG